MIKETRGRRQQLQRANSPEPPTAQRNYLLCSYRTATAQGCSRSRWPNCAGYRYGVRVKVPLSRNVHSWLGSKLGSSPLSARGRRRVRCSALGRWFIYSLAELAIRTPRRCVVGTKENYFLAHRLYLMPSALDNCAPFLGILCPIGFGILRRCEKSKALPGLLEILQFPEFTTLEARAILRVC